MASRILIVDDDRSILAALQRLLEREGYQVFSAVSAEEAITQLEAQPVELALLDVALPGQDGLSLCRQIRSEWRFPVIMLTGRGTTVDKIVGLEMGADDYVTKPFDPGELLARVRAQLRRSQEYADAAESAPIQVGSLQVDPVRRQVAIDGRALTLTEREFELLHTLARNRGRPLHRDQLFEAVWGYDSELAGNLLAVYVRRLRRKIERDPETPEYLHTVRGYGYKLDWGD
jgi:two-component system, OmpR family, response regulator VicR